VVGVKHTQALCRVYTISPHQGEYFYLRLLLHNVKGPQSFADLKTVTGDLCNCFQEACLKLGMTTSITWLWKRQLSAIHQQVFILFTVILGYCEPSNPLEIYDNHKKAMAEDFIHQQQVLLRDEHMGVNSDMFNLVLNDLQEKVISMGGRQLSEYGLPQPQAVDSDTFAREYRREISYDQGEQQAYVECNAALLTADQRNVYDCFCSMVDRNEGGVLFLDA